MGDAWFTEVPEELARCLLDAQRCAETCEAFLESLRASADAELLARATEVLMTPAAVARVLMDLVEHPAELVLAAARLCRDAAREGVQRARDLPGSNDVVTALETAADSCDGLLDATSGTH